ncbi:MAG: tetratricopeptide repeat protein [Gemmatimonadaceae bacterium]
MTLLRSFRHLLLSCVLLAPVAGGAQSAIERVAMGDREQAALRPAVALEHYEAAITLAPSNGDALGKASRTSVDLGEHDSEKDKRQAFFLKGEQYARRAVEASPNDPEAYFHLARALGRTALTVGVRERVRYATEIRRLALHALEMDPKHPGALHVMGVWNAEVMRLNGFERFFAKNVLGGGVFGQASWEDAVSYMQRAVAVDPARLTHHLDLGRVYRDIGDPARARQQFELVLKGPATDYNDPLYQREAEEALKSLK